MKMILQPVLVFLYFLFGCSSFRPLVSQRRLDSFRPYSSYLNLDSGKDAYESLLRFRDTISSTKNSTETILNLIQLGDDWWTNECDATVKHLNIDTVNENSGYSQVSGCMAKVKIKVEQIF